MKPKKFEEVKRISVKQRKPIWISTVIALIIIIILSLIVTIKGFIDLMELDKENKELTKIIEMKDSMIDDLQEDNMKLQEMIE